MVDLPQLTYNLYGVPRDWELAIPAGLVGVFVEWLLARPEKLRGCSQRARRYAHG